MNRIIKSITSAVLIILTTYGSANATLITQEQAYVTTGQNFTFDFTDLAASDGNGGTLTLSPGTLNDRFLGLDLDGVDEFIDISIEGTNFGRFECSSANDGGTLIPSAVGRADCYFSLELSFTGFQLDNFLNDSVLSVFIDFGSEVSAFLSSDQDTLILELAYEDDVSDVSAPAGLGFLLSGIGLLVFKKRRKVSQRISLKFS